MTDNHDDELIAFERQVAHLRGQNPTVAVELVLDRCTTLYEQHDADQQQIGELRAIVEQVAALYGATVELSELETPQDYTLRFLSSLVTQARAWLDAHPAP